MDSSLVSYHLWHMQCTCLVLFLSEIQTYWMSGERFIYKLCCWTKLGYWIKDLEQALCLWVTVHVKGNRCSINFLPTNNLWMCANIIKFAHLFLVPGNSGELWLDELLDLFSCENWLLSSVLWVLGDTSRLQDRTTHDTTVSSIRSHTGQTIDEFYDKVTQSSDSASWTLQATSCWDKSNWPKRGWELPAKILLTVFLISDWRLLFIPPASGTILTSLFLELQFRRPDQTGSWKHRGVPRNGSWPLCETGAGAHVTQTTVGSWKRLIQVIWAVLLRPMSLFRRICVFIKLRAEFNPFYSAMRNKKR